MRVISGSAGGLRLRVPEVGVRPTMDRVKAAIFSSLGERVVGARVLDLFAGAGGLGIEALSRGAESVVFVERERAAIACIADNLRSTNLSGRVLPGDVMKLLETRSINGEFDLIFADPPYARRPGDYNFGFALVQCVELAELLAPEGLFVLEIMPGERLPESVLFAVVRSRKYGKTETVFLRHVED